MRRTFVETLVALAAKDERIVLLTADMGYNALEPFRDAYPKRFFNVGVAEQNMIALATGLAEAGFVPFCYSIASFAVLRPLEFIRNGPILHQLPVRIVGMGGGLDYASNGISHYSVEDLAVLRTQPGISVFAPADSPQARRILEQTASLPGPIYYRLEKENSAVPELDARFTPGRPEHLITGRDVLFISVGGVTADVIAAARELTAHSVSAGVMVVSTLSPIDRALFADVLRRYPCILSVEAHYTTGGLGSLAAEIIAESQLGARLVRVGLDAMPDVRTGSRGWLHERHGLSRASLVQTALAASGRRPPSALGFTPS